MAVKIRLARIGAKKKPSYRIIVDDVESPRNGRFIEIIKITTRRRLRQRLTLKKIVFSIGCLRIPKKFLNV